MVMNRALCGKSVKFGTHVCHPKTCKFRTSAIAEFALGGGVAVISIYDSYVYFNALCGKITKLGTHLYHLKTCKFETIAIADHALGGRGSDFHFTSYSNMYYF